MAGTFSIGETKARPGVYHRRENTGGISLEGALNGIGAGIIRAGWGPLNQVVELDNPADAVKIFGTGFTEDLIAEMFAGGIVKGKFVRVGSGGLAPSVVLSDTEGTKCVEISGEYVGDRAFTISIRDNLINDKRELVIYEGASEYLKIIIEETDNEAEAVIAAVNASRKGFAARPVVSESGDGDGSDKVKLEDVTQKRFTGGENPTVTVTDYSTGLSALEAEKYNVLCVDTEDSDVHALMGPFLNRTYTAGAFPMACLAEKAEAGLETRMAKAAAFNDEKIHYCLNGGISANGEVYEGYKLAARIGGMIASVSSNASLTHQVVSGFTDLLEPLTNTQVEKALGKGCIVLTQNESGQIWIEQGINTLITPSGEQDEGWKKIRRVKTRFELMQRIVSTVDKIIGKVNNDNDGRAAVAAAGQGIINAMVAEKKLLSGSQIFEDTANPAVGDSAWFVIAVDDIDSLEKSYLTFQFRFAPENA